MVNRPLANLADRVLLAVTAKEFAAIEAAIQIAVPRTVAYRPFKGWKKRAGQRREEKKSATVALEVIKKTISPKWVVTLKLGAYQ